MHKLKDPPPFDPEAHKDIVWGDSRRKYFQNGHYYGPTGKYIDSEGDDNIELLPKAANLSQAEKQQLKHRREVSRQNLEKARKAKARRDKRAGKTDPLSGGVPSEVVRVEKENARAKQAEELAE